MTTVPEKYLFTCDFELCLFFNETQIGSKIFSIQRAEFQRGLVRIQKWTNMTTVPVNKMLFTCDFDLCLFLSQSVVNETQIGSKVFRFERAEFQRGLLRQASRQVAHPDVFTRAEVDVRAVVFPDYGYAWVSFIFTRYFDVFTRSGMNKTIVSLDGSVGFICTNQ